MEGSEHGVIFFALGATFKPEDIPKHQMEAFLEAFGRLPQRVLVRMQGGNYVALILARKVARKVAQKRIFLEKKY